MRLSVRRGMAPPAGAFVEVKAQLNPPLQPLRPGSYDFARDLYFQRIGASGFVHGAVKIVAPPAAAGWRLRANDIRSKACATPSTPHPLRAVRATRLDRLGADHRQARRDHAVRLRRHVRVRHRPRAVDLRLSHGGGRRHRVLHPARAAGADPRRCRPHAGQEMGGARRAARDRALSGAVRRRGRDPALVHHDCDRSDRRHARPAGADLAHDDDRGAGGAALGAGSGGASELSDVVCGDARADRRLCVWAAAGARRSGFVAWRRAPRCGA